LYILKMVLVGKKTGGGDGLCCDRLTYLSSLYLPPVIRGATRGAVRTTPKKLKTNTVQIKGDVRPRSWSGVSGGGGVGP